MKSHYVIRMKVYSERQEMKMYVEIHVGA